MATKLKLEEQNKNLQQVVDQKIQTHEKVKQEAQTAINGIDEKKSEAENAIEGVKNTFVTEINTKKSETLVDFESALSAQIEAKKSEFTNAIDEALNTLRSEFSTETSNVKDAIVAAKNASIILIDDKISEIETKTKEFLSNLINERNESNKDAKENLDKLTALKDELSVLVAKGFHSEAGQALTVAYNENANSHKWAERVFQSVCGASIVAAIGVLLFWVVKDYSVEANKWLPIATVTSLFLFIARWAARTAYRNGLESRRLRQYALDLSTMPAFFAQTLLQPNDETVDSSGRRIIERKAEKLFGNIERFDEQDSHGPMALIWKWLTKKFESEITSKAEAAAPFEEQQSEKKKSPPEELTGA